MNPQVPNELRVGDVITADWLAKIQRAVKASQMQPSPDHIVTVTGGGTTIHHPLTPTQGTERPPFYVYSEAEKFAVTDGVIHIPGFAYYEVSSYGPAAAADGDKVWLGYGDGGWTWAIDGGADWPTTFHYIPLATVDVTDDVATVALIWHGGDMVHADHMTVIVEKDGGEDGDDETLCSITYAVKTLDGVIALASEVEPINHRHEYVTYSAGSRGIAWFDDADGWKLYVYDEHPEVIDACPEDE